MAATHHLRNAVQHLATKPGPLRERIGFALDEFASVYNWGKMSPEAKACYTKVRDCAKGFSSPAAATEVQLQQLAELMFVTYELDRNGK